jgi:hypothetical protein
MVLVPDAPGGVQSAFSCGSARLSCSLVKTLFLHASWLLIVQIQRAHELAVFFTSMFSYISE